MATATRTPPPRPRDDTITLELSEEEAEYVLGSIGPHTGPLAAAIFQALDKGARVSRFSVSAELGRQRTRDAH